MAWNVLILGGGFGGLTAARRLERKLPHQSAIDAKVARLTVRYGTRGVPRSIYIDTDQRIADEESGYAIERFTPLKR